MAAGHRNISVKAVPSSSLVILPAGQKYPNGDSDSVTDEVKCQVFKKLRDLWVLPQFQSDVDTKGHESDAAQLLGAAAKRVLSTQFLFRQ